MPWYQNPVCLAETQHPQFSNSVHYLVMQPASPATSSSEDRPVVRGRLSQSTSSGHIYHPKVGERVQHRVDDQVVLCEVLRILVEPKPNTMDVGMYMLLDLATARDIMAPRTEIEHLPVLPRESEASNH
ncbi:unnamed protein product [Rhizoctonia solani]|uniref:Uncharacterized protein n=1 Tax=Rhizoctonia solani TaxID=456999 RepID=A0A8H2XNI8_9AGAM|nr:unnamed protein product [Rhizoctonia solani]